MAYLHSDREQFRDAIDLAYEQTGVMVQAIEKDYYVTMLLRLLAQRMPYIVFKGGTSLSKCHKVIRRFSEDIDITIDTLLSQGQKKKIKQAIVESAEELGMTIENLDETRSRRDYNRYVIAYDSVIPMASDALKAAVLLETSYTAVSFPTVLLPVHSYIGDMMEQEAPDAIEEYNLNPFEMKVQGIDRTLADILENQTYVGDTINNKSTQKLFAGQDKHDLPKEQWYVAKNTHPAIIARDDFEKVQKILNKNRAVFKTVRAKSEQIRAEYQNDLAGMVFCADCGRPMEFERLPHGAEESKKVCYYICKARQADDKCIGHQIPEKLLKALIMDQLHLFIVQLSDKRKVLKELQKIEDVQNPVYRAKGEIMSLTDKVSQMAKKREQLYADYVAGVVDSEDYQLIREDYSRQYDGLRAALQEAENKKAEVERQIEEYLNMTSHLEEHLDNFEFDIQLVKSLVQKIEVSADKRIRIIFGFQDVFTELGKESAET